jgi:hypothetical protein
LVDESIRQEWEAEQNRLKLQLVEEDKFEWVLDLDHPENTTLKRVAAIDISYSKHNE